MSHSGTPLGGVFADLAAAAPDRPALTCAGTTVTRAELDRRTNALARAYGELGAAPGEFVSISLPNGVEFVEAVLATWKLGGIPQPVSAELPAGEREAILELVRPALVVGVEPQQACGFRSVRAGAARRDLDDGPLPFAVAPSWKAPTSGGSTGRPKVIVAGEPGLLEHVEVYADLMRHEADEVCLMTGPLHHNGPFLNAVLSLLRGGHVVLQERFDAQEALRLMEHRATWVYAVPTMLQRVWRLPEQVRTRPDLSCLRTVLHTAAPCPGWLKQAWIDWLGPEVMLEIYGGTEAQAMTALDGAEWQRHRGSVGAVRLGEMRVLDAEGRDLPPGEPGAVWMRRGEDARPTYRYLGADPVTRDGGWDWLGDTGWFDKDGYLYVGDRSADLILVGGANVYPAEVEAALEAHPQVLSSCVVGLPHEDLGAVPHALVQVEGAVLEEELRAHVAHRLVGYKRPRSYQLVATALRDASGKVRRAELRAAALAAGARAASDVDACPPAGARSLPLTRPVDPSVTPSVNPVN